MPEPDVNETNTAYGKHRKSWPVILAAVLAALTVVVAVSLRVYKSTPSFSISQLRKAFANNDPDSAMQYLDADAMVDHFLRNTNKGDPEVVAFAALMKEKLKEGLRLAAAKTVDKNEIRRQMAGSMADEPMVDREGVGAARVSFSNKTFVLLMKSNIGDKRWRIVGIEGVNLEKWIRALGLNAPAGVLANLPPYQERGRIE